MDNVLIVLLSIIIVSVIGIWLFTFFKLRRLTISSERELGERELAKELAEQNKIIALEVREEGREYITQVISIMKQDIELARSLITSKIEVLDLKMQQRIEMNELELRNMKHDIARAQKALEFIQTMTYGSDAKSEPAY